MAHHWRAPIIVPDAYSDLAPVYDNIHTSKADRAEDAVVRDLLYPLVDRASWCAFVGTAYPSLVDLGCGTGWLLDNFPHASGFYLGVDISPGMIERAQEKHPGCMFMEQDMLQPIPYQADVVTSTFGACSYVNPDLLVDALDRILRPGGMFFLQAYSPAYESRPSYVMKDQDLGSFMWGADFARDLFAKDGRFSVRVESWWSRRCEQVASVSTTAAAALASAEVVCGSEQGYWTIITGSKL